MTRYASYTEIVESTGGVWLAMTREDAEALFREEVENASVSELDFSVTLWEVEVSPAQESNGRLAEELSDEFWLELPTRGEPPREVSLFAGTGTARLIRRAWKYHEREES